MNLLKVGKHARGYFVCMLLTAIFIGGLALQSFVTPTLLLDDTISLANHYLEYQFQHQEEFTNPVHFPAYAGALTYLGVLIWWGGGITCLFAANLLPSELTEKRYLIFAGTISLIWAADDLYGFHKPLPSIVIFYALALLLLFFFYRQWLIKQPLLPLAIGLLFFALSLLIDEVSIKSLSIQDNAILEEGAKIIGIISWTLFHIFTASQSLHQKTGGGSQ